MTRLDFNFEETPIKTHGYEMTGDRTKDANTLNKFSSGPKVGDGDVGAYNECWTQTKIFAVLKTRSSPPGNVSDPGDQRYDRCEARFVRTGENRIVGSNGDR